MLLPIVLQFITNNIENLNVHTIMYFLILLIFTSVMQVVSIFIRENFAAKVNANYAKNLYKKMFKLTYDKLLELEPTYIIERIATSVNALYTFFTSSMTGLLSSIITILIALIITFFISKPISLLLLLIIPINFFGYKKINKKLQLKVQEMQEVNARNYKNIISIIKDVDYMKQLDNHEPFMNLINPYLEEIYHTTAVTNKYGQSTSMLLQTFNMIVQNLSYLWICFSIVQGRLEISNLLIISIIFPIYFNAINGLSRCNLNLRDLKASNHFVASELDSNIEVQPSNSTGDVLSSIEEIHVNNPTFQFKDKTMDFKIEETFHKGDIVFLSGPSGIGKSTFLKLLLRFRNSKGIKINNIPLDEIELSQLRRKISYISQDNVLLPVSIKDNITYGRTIDESKLNQLSETKLLKSILAKKDLSTIILENGSNLSGGEKQRLIIARTLLDHSEVLLLDEITSNIDKESADDIYSYILENSSNKIVFIVSHDKNVKEFCNKYVELG